MTEANLEWHVTYVEASLPAAEIAGATRQKRTRAVALSLVYPKDDSRLESELALLDDYLKPEVVIVVGGLLAQKWPPRSGLLSLKQGPHNSNRSV